MALNFTINRSSSGDNVVIHKDGKDHTFQLSGLTKQEQDRIREMIVDSWATENGFAPIYTR